MATTYDLRSDADHTELLERLIAARGIGRHGLFFVTSEGKVTPDGFEEMSGYVVGSDGHAFFFWTGWNEQTQQSDFKIWRPAERGDDWLTDDEVQTAFRAAGCAANGPA